MKFKSINEIQEIYDLELDKVVKTIKKQKGKAGSKSKNFKGYKVLLQFPEGLKPYAQVICSYVEEEADCNCFIWMNSCYGGCDLPLETERLGIDLVIQFGHSKWEFKKDVEVL